MKAQKGGITKMVTLEEVLEAAGYHVRENVDDARWLTGQASEFDGLYEAAVDLDERYSEYEEYVDDTCDEPMSFEEWEKGERK